MAQPVYKLWLFRFTEAWYQLSPEEQQRLLVLGEEALAQVGGRAVWSQRGGCLGHSTGGTPSPSSPPNIEGSTQLLQRLGAPYGGCARRVA